MGLPAAYQTRLQALYTWRAAFADANCRHEIWNADTRYRMFRVAELDLDLCDAVTRILAGCLQQIHTSENGVDAWDDAFDAAQEDLAPFGTSAIEQLYPRAELWDNNKSYTPGQFIKSAQVPGWVFVCIQGGRSGSSEPSDAQGAETPARANSTQYAVGDRVLPATENGWIYQCTNAGTSGAAEPEATAGIAATYWAASTAYSLGQYIVPNSKNAGRYRCTTAGTTAATYPTFGTTDGGTTTSGANTAYAEGAICEPGDGRKYVAVTGGISHASVEPVFSPTAGAITDGTVVWHVLNALPTTENATCADGTLLWSAVSRYWAASTAVAAGTVAEPGNGYRYLCTVAGVTDTSLPTWPTSPGTVTDGTVTWTLLGGWEDTLGAQTYDGSVIWEAYEQYWEAEAAYTEDDTMLPWTGQKYICTATGDSGTVEPIWTAGYAAFADGAASWQRQSAVTSGSAEAIQPDRVEYVSNVWQWNGVTESTETITTPGQPGKLASFGGQAGAPPTPPKVEKITTLDKSTYVYARVWRINDGLVQPIYSRSWFTSTMSGT
ncbi:MAG: hypothetical protein MUC79_16465, partial [Thiobacillaceae bacterium]|nr:hypothetical protein [Thiobacillaceae bacterium]